MHKIRMRQCDCMALQQDAVRPGGASAETQSLLATSSTGHGKQNSPDDKHATQAALSMTFTALSMTLRQA